MSQRHPDDDIARPPSGGRQRGGSQLPPSSHRPCLSSEKPGEGRGEKAEARGGRLLRDWLARREPAAPARLSVRMRAALDQLEAEPEDTPSALGAAALVCLRDALAKGSRREAAVDLLAADALLTYGCEAAAEAGPGALERFANDYGAARLAALLPDPHQSSSSQQGVAGRGAPTGDRSP